MLALASACSGDDNGPPSPALTAVEVSPAAVTVIPLGTAQFSALGRLSDGGTGSVSVSWSASGGTISGTGLYTAPSTEGTYRVIARANGGSLADTAQVTVQSPPPTLVAVEIAPSSAALAPGGTQQFTALGRLSNGTTQAIAIDWSATGGTVSGTGLYTAGTSDGAFRVIAKAAGGTPADTAAVTITTPPPSLVAIEISPDSARLSYTNTQQFTAIGRLSDGGTAPVAVTWSTTTFPSNPQANTIDAAGLFRAGAPIGRYVVTATEVGGAALSATVPVTVHSTTGVSVSGPTFWRPTAGKVYLCTSNHYTDDGDGRGGAATTTVSSGGGVTQPTVNFVNDGVPQVYGDGTGEVKVACQEVWSAPGGSGDVTVTVAVTSTRPGTGMAKIFTYTLPCPVGDCRAQYTHSQDFAPLMTTGTVTESVVVSETTGANIWFKSTYVP